MCTVHISSNVCALETVMERRLVRLYAALPVEADIAPNPLAGEGPLSVRFTSPAGAETSHWVPYVRSKAGSTQA